MRQYERKRDKEGLRHFLRDLCDHIIEEHTFAEEIPLTHNPDERHVIAISLVALGTTTDIGYCERFADFMRSKQGKEILQRFGFVTK
jgi:ABC-type molybdate transport system substrate-binding protein